MYTLDHVIRDYAWGSTTSLPQLLGIEATGQPMAELWLGGHPDSPARARLEDGQVPLDALIERDPVPALGQASRDRFGARLPYLLKILAANQALSLQVHPTEARAAEGFAEEEAAGVAKDARERRYKDPHHKPEMVVALTEFHALCGLRPVEQTVTMLRDLEIDHPGADALLRCLGADDEEHALRSAFELLLGGEVDADGLAAQAVSAARGYLDVDPIGDFAPVCATVLDLERAYPGDPGIAVSLLLNRVTLQPGEALFLPAGNVHAYLAGTAIEVMATSDNVLRAGLTPKYIDVAELMDVVEFQPQSVPYVRPEVSGPVRRYRPDVAEFELATLDLRSDSAQLEELGPRVVLCLEGQVAVAAGGQRLTLARGEAAFVPDADGVLTVSGSGRAVLATVPS